MEKIFVRQNIKREIFLANYIYHLHYIAFYLKKNQQLFKRFLTHTNPSINTVTERMTPFPHNDKSLACKASCLWLAFIFNSIHYSSPQISPGHDQPSQKYCSFLLACRNSPSIQWLLKITQQYLRTT